MNIGIVTTWFERGAALVSRAYLDALTPVHNVYIYARGGERSGIGQLKWDQPYVTWGKAVTDRIQFFIDWPDFQRWIAQRQLDVILFNEQHSWEVILNCLKSNVVIGAYVDYYTAETVPFFPLYDFLLCNTRRHSSVFTQHPQAVYIPWGTDCALFNDRAATSRSDTIRFFHSAGMGGVGLRKGTDILVRAFQKVTGPAKLIIHSQVSVETYHDVAHLIKSDPRIEFIEATVGAPGLYSLGDVYVYPTRLEGIGLTIIEALACGLPVITTDNGPMNEFVQDGVTGKLVAVERYQSRVDDYYWPESICSEAALTEAMQWYIDHPTQLPDHRRQARAHAMKHLSWAENSKQLPTLFTRFSKIEKPAKIITAARRYEREAEANLHMAETFSDYALGDFAGVRHHLSHGVWYAPRWLRNRGVWSIAFQAFFGRRLSRSRQPITHTLASSDRK